MILFCFVLFMTTLHFFTRESSVVSFNFINGFALGFVTQKQETELEDEKTLENKYLHIYITYIAISILWTKIKN